MQQSKQSCWERFPTKQFQIYSQRDFACVEGGRRNSVFLGDIGRGKWSETRSSVALLIPFATEMELPPITQSAVRKASIYIYPVSTSTYHGHFHSVCHFHLAYKRSVIYRYMQWHFKQCLLLMYIYISLYYDNDSKQ